MKSSSAEGTIWRAGLECASAACSKISHKGTERGLTRFGSLIKYGGPVKSRVGRQGVAKGFLVPSLKMRNSSLPGIRPEYDSTRICSTCMNSSFSTVICHIKMRRIPECRSVMNTSRQFTELRAYNSGSGERIRSPLDQHAFEARRR